MTLLFWAAIYYVDRHPFIALLFAGASLVIGWTVVLAFGESPEQRDARRRKERVERAKLNLARNIAWYKEQERAKALQVYDAKVDAIVEEVLSGDDEQTRMREAEAFNATEYERESDGKRVA